ncbi:MAG: hypothetical protein EXQ58_11450 [Acidobacteria bacterium]|nr:hypothetical protein [Acidobacteriota bacterium]
MNAVDGRLSGKEPWKGRKRLRHTKPESGDLAHTYTNLPTRIIFSTKDRLPHIDADLRPQLNPYMVGILRELDGKTSIINGASDHVHVLTQLPPVLALADAMRILAKHILQFWPLRAG